MNSLKKAMILADEDMEPTEIVLALIDDRALSDVPTETAHAYETAEHIESVGESNWELIKQLEMFGLFLASPFDGAKMVSEWVECVAGQRYRRGIVRAVEHILARASRHYGHAVDIETLCERVGGGLSRLMDHGAERYCPGDSGDEAFFTECERLVSDLVETFDSFGLTVDPNVIGGSSGEFVAELVEINNPLDLVEVRNEHGEVVGRVHVKPEEDSAPYDVAVRKLIGDKDFSWAR